MGPFSAETRHFFPLIGVVCGQYSDESFTRFQTKQGVPKKFPPSKWMQIHPSDNPPCRAVPPSPFVSPSALNDRVAAELRLNWG
jgi:hypothetical protein